MTDKLENQLIAELSRRVVREVAPEERRTFNAISEAYFKNPEKTLKGEGGDDELLGWGLAEVSLLLTPIILEVVKEVLKDLLKDSITESIKNNSPTLLEKLKTFVRRLFGGNSSPSPQPQYVELSLLSKEQLIRIHQKVTESVMQWEVDPNKASLIADSVVANLHSISRERHEN